MPHQFNNAGPSKPAQHQVIDPPTRVDLPDVLALIDAERYFVLHAPRQTGKTTCLLALLNYLNAEGRSTSKPKASGWGICRRTRQWCCGVSTKRKPARPSTLRSGPSCGPTPKASRAW